MSDLLLRSVPPESDSSQPEDMPTKCPNCGKGPFVRDEESGELVCANCGYVLLERAESEQPSFSEGVGGAAVGSGPPTSIARPDMGLSTVIGRVGTEATGGKISRKGRSSVERMRVWDRRSQPKTPGARGMTKAFDEMRTISAKLSLGKSTVEQAAYIYRKAARLDLSRGRSTLGLAAACLYAACREERIPRSLKDIAAAANLRMKELTRSYRVIVNALDIKMPVEDPIRSLARIASAIDAPPNVIRRARKILDRANAEGLSAGKDPMALAGAALYLSSQLEGHRGKTQKDVAEAAEVSELTLRNRYHSLKASLKL